MSKKISIFFLMLFAFCFSSVALAEPRLVTIHNTVVNFIGDPIPLESVDVANGGTDFDGAVSYDTARFFALTLEVADDENELPFIETFNPPHIPLTISGGNYSFWNSYTLQEVNNAQLSFDLAMSNSVVYYENQDLWWGAEKTGYVPTNSEGDWIHFLQSADNGLNGATVTWNYPDSDATGTGTIPNFKTTSEQLNDVVPCIEYTATGTLANGDLVTTGLKWRFVLSDDIYTTVLPSEDIHFQVRVCGIDSHSAIFFDNEGTFTTISADNGIAEGEIAFNEAKIKGAPWCTIVRYYFGDKTDEIYQWRFVTKNMSWLDSFGATTGATYSIQAGLKDGKADYTYTQYKGTDVFSLGTHPDIVEAKYFTDQGKIRYMAEELLRFWILTVQFTQDSIRLIKI